MNHPWIFWLLYIIDSIVAAIIFYFFVIGLLDGTVSSFNAVYWIAILVALALIMFGGVWLKNHGHPGVAILLISVLAAPAFLYFIFMLILLISNPKWN
ncbi:MAG: osmoprotectant transporter permease [Saprospiraceae bacterium]